MKLDCLISGDVQDEIVIVVQSAAVWETFCRLFYFCLRATLFCMRARWVAILFLLLPAIASAEFNRDLYFGMRGNPDVVRLQEFLRAQGYFTYPQSTGNYFTATLQAVKKFQQAEGVPALGGYFGPQSRAIANRILGEDKEKLTTIGASGSGGSATTSPHKGKIAIGYVSGWSSTAEGETITLENRSEKDTVSISGFQIENSRGGIFVIPRGQDLPGLYPTGDDPILLKSREQAVIAVGKQDRRMNFRENLCTGYFDETSNFSPGLSHACPLPDIRTLGTLTDRCLDIISSASSCRMITPSFPSRVLDADCSAYVNTHLNYLGCVNDYRARPDFYSHRWLIWMQRDQEFFRNTVERVTVKDRAGKVVDEYSY